MKKCPDCGETKPHDTFSRNKRRPDGYARCCKTCTNAYARSYYGKSLEDNRAKKRDYTAKRGDDHRAMKRANARRWREQNPEKARAKDKRDAQALRERHPTYFREWYQRNIEHERERVKLVMRKARAEDPERARVIKRRYRERNADAVRKRERENTYVRRAKQPYSKELAALMAELIQQPCVYCGATENITVDHVIPLARGGKHEATNLAPACLPCNCSKNDRLLSEWKGRFGA